MSRCDQAITFGEALNTRCRLEAGHTGMHEGKGLTEFNYQLINWTPTDARGFVSDRTDEYGWRNSAPGGPGAAGRH